MSEQEPVVVLVKKITEMGVDKIQLHCPQCGQCWTYHEQKMPMTCLCGCKMTLEGVKQRSGETHA